MNRRKFLALTGVTASVGVGGCLDDGESDFVVEDLRVRLSLDEEFILVRYDVRNRGNSSGKQEVTLELTNRTTFRWGHRRTIYLESGEVFRGTFYQIYSDSVAEDSDIDITVKTEDDSKTVRVLSTIYSDGRDSFEITTLQPRINTNNTKTLLVEYEVENDGDSPAVQDVRLLVDGRQVDFDTVHLDAGEQFGSELHYQDFGDTEQNESVTLTIGDEPTGLPVFQSTYAARFASDNLDQGLVAGEEATLEYVVENTESREGSKPIEILVDGDVRKRQWVHLPPEGQTQETFTFTPANAGGETTVMLSGDRGDEERTYDGQYPDRGPMELADAFRAESTELSVTLLADDPDAPHESGFNLLDRGSGASEPSFLALEGAIDDGTWDSTTVDIAEQEPASGPFGSVRVSDGLSGELDEEVGRMTIDGRIQIEVPASFLGFDDTEADSMVPFEMDIAATTGESGHLNGSFETRPPYAVARLVDNESTLDAFDPDSGSVDPDVAETLNQIMGLPLEPGEFWLEMTLVIQNAE